MRRPEAPVTGMFVAALVLAVLGLAMRWPSETASTAYGLALAVTIASLPVPKYEPRHRAERGTR